MRQLYGNLLGLFALAIALSLGFFVEFFYEKEPCILCFLQRLAISGVAVGLYLNLHFGVNPKFYGCSLLWCLFGMSVALKHLSLNAYEAPLDPPFLFFGFRLYTWSLLVFFASLLGMGILLLGYEVTQKRLSPRLRCLGFLFVLLPLALGILSVAWRRGLGF